MVELGVINSSIPMVSTLRNLEAEAVLPFMKAVSVGSPAELKESQTIESHCLDFQDLGGKV